MNEITIQQWLEGLRGGLKAKGAADPFMYLQLVGFSKLTWQLSIKVEDEVFSVSDKATPDEVLIAGNEWVSKWMHPDKRLALVLGIGTEPKAIPIEPVDAVTTIHEADDSVPF